MFIESAAFVVLTPLGVKCRQQPQETSVHESPILTYNS
jgi:hypothetical protein